MIVDILSQFIITQTSKQPERPWLLSVNQICCLGLHSIKDVMASCLASCLELLVYEANTPPSTQTVDGAFSSFCVSIWETEYCADIVPNVKRATFATGSQLPIWA